MKVTMIRVSAVSLAVILGVPSASEAQDRNTTDARHFRLFLESISVRRNARVCERGIANYGKTFGDLYGRWTEKHRAEMTRGESVLREALKTQDLKKYPFTNREALVRADAALVELADPPKTTSPLTLDARTTAACDRVLAFLKD